MKKKIFFRILSFCMIFCFALVGVGCAGSGLSKEDYEEGFDDEDLEDAKVVDMYGAKVLYRPDDYDYDEGSGAGEDETNNYYGAYAYYILQDLFDTYGLSVIDTVLGTETPEGTREDGRLPNFNVENLSYLYDSMRYQVDTLGYVTLSQKVLVDDFGNISARLEQPLPIEETGGEAYYILGADTNVKWDWSLVANSDTSNELLKAYIYNDETIAASNDGGVTVSQGNKVFLNSSNAPSDVVDNYYSYVDTFNSTLYQTLYLSSNTDATLAPYDETSYSGLVKALEYVIYCYAVDLDPGEIEINFNDDYTYDIEVQITDSRRGTVDEAVESAKQTFKILGAYVGLVDRQIEKIEAWILNNIIGTSTVEADDSFTSYTGGQTDANLGVVEFLAVDEEGEYILDEEGNVIIVGYGFETAQSSSSLLGRDYETAVENIVAGVCENVSIGNIDGEDITIDQRFLASNIMEYAGNTFVVGDDSNFVLPGQGNMSDLGSIYPLEYQSVVLMLDREIYLDGIMIALKYDAGLDGTVEDVYDETKYIDIIVDLNYYNSATKERQVLASRQVRVYDGPFDNNYQLDYDIKNPDPNDYPAQGGGAPENLPKEHTNVINFDNLGQIHIGEFNVNIGEDILMTDVGTVGNYTSRPYVSTEPLKLVGTSKVINYYEVVEYGSNPEYDTDDLPKGQTYISGRLNPAMFGDSDGCDYIEITYKVLKKAGDTETNYKFYTGLVGVDYSEEPYEY